MLTTLALAAVLSLAPAQDGPLTISNERITFCGEFGPTRPSNKFLPGDTFYLAFDVDNLRTDTSGVAKYSMGMEVTSATGQKIYQQAPAKQELVLPLGGNKMPARGYVNIDLSTPPGVYTCRLTVTDLSTNAAKNVDKVFEVQPASFGMVSMFASADEKGDIPTALMGIPGQVMYLHFFVVGFGRDVTTKQPNVTTELRILDQNNQPTTTESYSMVRNKDVEEKATGLPFTFRIPLNRSGVFTIEVKAECKVTGKPYKISFPITVYPSPK
jgi:hypothetical protein